MFISKISTKKVLLIILLLTILSSGIQVSAQSFLTEDELDYITRKNIIKAVSLNGAAPIQYAGSDGQVKGISKEVLDEISHMTGLVFEYQLYDTLEDMYKSGADIVFGMPPNYAIDKHYNCLFQRPKMVPRGGLTIERYKVWKSQ